MSSSKSVNNLSKCYFKDDAVYNPVKQVDHISGHFVGTIYKTDLSAWSLAEGIAGLRDFTANGIIQ